MLSFDITPNDDYNNRIYTIFSTTEDGISINIERRLCTEKFQSMEQPVASGAMLGLAAHMTIKVGDLCGVGYWWAIGNMAGHTDENGTCWVPISDKPCVLEIYRPDEIT